jgi:hypothetical protein
MPAVYTVTATSDGQGGPGTLTWAINQANGDPGSTIDFKTGTTSYALTSGNALPQIAADVTIEGTSGGGGVTIDAALNQGLFVS